MKAETKGNCFNCEKADLQPARLAMRGTIRGEQYTVGIDGLRCPACGYETLEGSAMQEYGRLLADKYRAAHGLLTSEQILGIRNRLGMTQAAFARHLDVGIASVKRWELGKIQDKRSNEIILEKTKPTIHCAGVNFTVASAITPGAATTTFESFVIGSRVGLANNAAAGLARDPIAGQTTFTTLKIVIAGAGNWDFSEVAHKVWSQTAGLCGDTLVVSQPTTAKYPEYIARA